MPRTRPRRTALLSAAIVTLLLGACAAVAFGQAGGHAPISPMKVFRGKVNTPFGASNNMTYQGGPVETGPAVYVVYWGSWWNTSAVTGQQNGVSFGPTAAASYVNSLFSNVGGSSWENINSQYCQGVATGTVNCGTSGQHVANVTSQLKGTWIDTSSVPAKPSQSQIAAEAQNAAAHFGYSSSQPAATVFVLTPSGNSMSGFGTSWCAWHSVTAYNGTNLPYAYLPYQPDAGGACGENFVNATSDTFGNGYFDGFSVVGGHEYAEAETDPVTASGHYAWVDRRGSEIGDKCAWSSASGNVTLGGNSFAMQPLWSNASSACRMNA